MPNNPYRTWIVHATRWMVVLVELTSRYSGLCPLSLYKVPCIFNQRNTLLNDLRLRPFAVSVVCLFIMLAHVYRYKPLLRESQVRCNQVPDCLWDGIRYLIFPGLPVHRFVAAQLRAVNRITSDGTSVYAVSCGRWVVNCPWSTTQMSARIR